LNPEAIFEKGVEEEEGPCRDCVNYFLRVYGRVTADIALMTMPYGGIYLVGNMTVFLKDFFTSNNNLFLESFYSKDCNTIEVLKKFPIYLVDRKGLGLYGATLKSQMDLFKTDDVQSDCWEKK
jgi:glucokinase